MTKLSVNINKIALVRNSRGGNMPDVKQMALDIESFGGEGITVHPRPDQRHIRYSDLYELKPVLKTEFNIEGYPSEFFIKTVCDVKPAQVTLVPDAPDALTSDNGWDTKQYQNMLAEIIQEFKKHNIRTSIFVNPEEEMVEYAKLTGTDRIELYTESYATDYSVDREKAIEPFVRAAIKAQEVGLGLNAGHDLNLENLNYFVNNIPNLLEVSIGHALVSDAFYYGMQNTIMMYLKQMSK
ncbi:MAG: pyridoxine 5'-phosphate synthase [Bacteroidales bacterium]|nr:pyridoxine 5'-phosphate synthase [Bacteroidales bacterium]